MLKTSGMRAVLAAAATVSLIGSAAQAATYNNVTYIGPSGGDFATASNWNPVRVPGTPAGQSPVT